MIDLFTIFSRGGAVLWSKQLEEVQGEPVNAFVQNIVLQDRTGQDDYKYNHGTRQYTLKWTVDNKTDLLFVAVFCIAQRINIEKFLDDVRKVFVDSFQEDLNPLLPSYDFDEKFENVIAKHEAKLFERARSTRAPKSFAETKKGKKVLGEAAETSKKPSKRKDDGGEASDNESDEAGADTGSANTADTTDNTDDNDFVMVDDKDVNETEEGAPTMPPPMLAARFGSRGRGGKPRGFKGKKKKNKSETPAKKTKARKWGDQIDADEAEELDFSKKPTESVQQEPDEEVQKVDASKFDYHSDEESDEEADEKSSSGGMFSFLSGIVGGKTLTRADLEPVLEKFHENLMAKNVAIGIADKLCESVITSLEGKTTGRFQTVKAMVKTALEEALTRILTPKQNVDILQGVLKAKQEGRPFSIVMVGVNGVGKSTSLAKLCAYFLSKNLKVSIAACDTFRAGAVEQLKTHARRLDVPLFQRGYSKDAAAVAYEGIKEGKRLGSDVVLVDTAGRMQDNEPLMRALSKLINLNKPDLVLFVGEALVGNDAVDQLKKFNLCLADLATDNNPRLIDGIILTKFDTIDDKVGAAISMTYETGQPIMFVGTGQDYTDLKRMNVKMLTRALLK